MADKSEDQLVEETRQALRKIFASLPPAYAERYRLLSSIRQSVHEEMGSAWRTSLNEHLKTVPQQTIQERSDLVAFVNHEARMLGLALRCPRTQGPAILVLDRQDAKHPAVARYRFLVRDERRRAHYTVTSQDVPELDLMPAPPRIEPFSRRFQGPDDSTAKRTR